MEIEAAQKNLCAFARALQLQELHRAITTGHGQRVIQHFTGVPEPSASRDASSFTVGHPLRTRHRERRQAICGLPCGRLSQSIWASALSTLWA